MPDGMPPMRIGHAERDRAVDRLKAAFAEGRLDHDELDTRLQQALAARTHQDLCAALADLPAASAAAGPAPSARGSDACDPRLLCLLLCVCPPAGLAYWLLTMRRHPARSPAGAGKPETKQT